METTSIEGSCECGAVRIEAKRVPAVRFNCHCTTCQQIYGAPFADIAALWSHQVRVVEGASHLDYKRYRRFPTSVKRGFCQSCDRPVVGHLTVPPSFITFCPVAVFGDSVALPESAGHIFYQSRVTDVDDELPKVSGFWRSELAATSWMLPRLLGR